MIKKEVLAALMDSKKEKIVRVVFNAPDELYLKEIAGRSGVPMTSAYRILQELVASGILQRRHWKTSKVYSPAKTEQTDMLKELFFDEYDGVKVFVQKVGELPGVQQLLLQGTRKKGKANVLIIGQAVDVGVVESACQEIRSNGFELGYLTLTKEQYEQMVKMGLYSGEKVVLKG